MLEVYPIKVAFPKPNLQRVEVNQVPISSEDKGENAGLVETPASNTGLKCQSVSLGYKNLGVKLDWLQGTCRFATEQEFRDLIDFVVDSFDDSAVWEPGQPAFMGKTWSNRGNSVRGIRWGWNPPQRSSGQLGCGFLIVPGSVLGCISARQCWRICLGLLNNWDFKATRFDAAVDDYSKSLCFDSLIEALRSCNYSRFRTWSVIQSNKDDCLGWTIYCGSSQSDSRTRIYDKDVESRGKVKSHRLETQLRNELANQAFREFVSIPSEHFAELGPTFLGSIVTGSIEFVSKQTGDRLARQERLAWWQEFVDMFGQVRFSAVKPIQTVARKLDWLYHQVAPTLAILRQGLGVSELADMLKVTAYKAVDRLNRQQLAMVSQIRRERSLLSTA